MMWKTARTVRVWIGLAIWVAAASTGWWCLAGRGAGSSARPELSRQLWDYAMRRPRVATMRSQKPFDLRRGDPVFVVQGPESVHQVGEVVEVSAFQNGCSGTVLFYSCAPAIGPTARLRYHQTPQSIQWVLRTMLGDAKRRQIAAELSQSFQRHREEVLRVLRPVVEEAFREAIHVVERDLPPALDRRRAELERIGGRYQREIVEKELVPLVREEIWPIVRRHAEPTATEVGREIWQRASLWRFGWRYAYDRSPLPEKHLTEREWSRFLEEDVAPVLESHTDDFIAVQQEILADVARSPRVRQVVRGSLAKIAADPETQRIAWEVIQEVIVENPRLREVIDKHWHSQRAQQAVRVAAARLEPTAVRIGELLLGTPRDGITPEFARVLRSQILAKDRRWLVLETAGNADSQEDVQEHVLPVSLGAPDALNPFVRESDPLLSKRARYAAEQ